MQVLVFDIGGTNCRMAVAEEIRGGIVLRHRCSFANYAWHSIPELEPAYCAELARWGQEKDAIRAVCLAVAGPVSRDRASLTNRDVHIVRQEAEALFQVPVCLANDFEAVSRSMDAASGCRVEHLYGDAPDAGLVRASAGAGTGFGCGILLPDGSYVPSEGGHMTLALAGAAEQSLIPLLGELPEVDDVVTGRGLEALALALTGQRLKAGDIAARWLQDEENEVFRTFAGLFGRACRNWALAAMCRGGLWLAGGIAMKNPLLVKSAIFRRAFVQGSGGIADFLQHVPVSLFRDEDVGLRGAALIALRAARRGC